MRNVYAVVGRAPDTKLIASVSVELRSFVATRVFPLPQMSSGRAVDDSRETKPMIRVNTGNVVQYLCVRRDALLYR